VPVLVGAGLTPRSISAGSNVIVVDDDGYYWSSSVAEAAAQAGHRVTVVTRMFEPFRELPMVSRITTLRALDQHGASIQPNTEVISVKAGNVALRHYLSGRVWHMENVAAILWTGAQAPVTLACGILEGVEVHTIGDAISPRRLVNALTEAHLLARTI
jgi:NADPH-dependent 2,4-dienoyl-CoA reductase/sulfur reductase-like enzyme